MLSMKTLRVAIVAMGSALLLGPGLATAVNVVLDATPGENLDGVANAGAAPVYAIETFGDSIEMGAAKYYTLVAPGGDLMATVRAKRLIEGTENIWARLELGDGLVFDGGAVTMSTPNNPTITSGGGAGSSFVVFKLSGAVDNAGNITIDLDDNLAVMGAAGSYTATMTAYTNPDDAIEGVGDRGTLFVGTETIVSVTSGLNVSVAAGATATAQVSTGFLWFVEPDNSPPLAGQKKLGYVSVAAKEYMDTTRPLAANDGELIDVEIDLVAEAGIGITVEGDLSVGAFSIIPDLMDDMGVRSATCPGGAATEDAPDQGNLMDEDGEYLVDEEGMASAANSGMSRPLARLPRMDDGDNPQTVTSNAYSLCVNVDILGKATNTSPVPAGSYTGTVMVTGTADGAEAQEAGSGTIGNIARNGASVEIAYLTVSDKYNQRLIIANRGSLPALFDLGEFVTEAGTEVMLSTGAMAAREAGLNMVPAKGQLVLKVSDLLEFSGDRNRAAATLSVNANASAIQVATTQVNLEDGSTDTVTYPTYGGAGLNN